MIDDSKDYSTEGMPTYTYENGLIDQSYDITDEEIRLSDALSKPHTHPQIARHYSSIPHSHSIRNVVNAGKRSYTWRPDTAWTVNSHYSNAGDWPTVAWTTSKALTVNKQLSLSVGVTDSVVSSAIGADYAKSHTVSTSTTRTFKVPYKKKGRIKVTYTRPYRTFTCVTYYFPSGTAGYEQTGAGSALGATGDKQVNLETANL